MNSAIASEKWHHLCQEWFPLNLAFTLLFMPSGFLTDNSSLDKKDVCQSLKNQNKTRSCSPKSLSQGKSKKKGTLPWNQGEAKAKENKWTFACGTHIFVSTSFVFLLSTPTWDTFFLNITFTRLISYKTCLLINCSNSNSTCPKVAFWYQLTWLKAEVMWGKLAFSSLMLNSGP